MLFSAMLSQLISSSTTSSNGSDPVAIITTVLTLLTLIAAGWALIYAGKSAKAAKDAVDPLDRIADDIKESARLQSQTLESARQLRRIELLSRRATILQQIVNAIAVMTGIPSETAPESIDIRFNQERRRLILALKMVPDIQLPTCHKVAGLGRYRDVLPDLTSAGTEADEALTNVLRELEQEASKEQTQTPAPSSKVEQPKSTP
jgi:hypothetical protein